MFYYECPTFRFTVLIAIACGVRLFWFSGCAACVELRIAKNIFVDEADKQACTNRHERIANLLGYH